MAPLEKEAARAKVADAVKNLPWDDRVLCVRINAWDTEWTYGDVIEVASGAGDRLDELMLPKVQTAAEGGGAGPAAHPGGEEERPALWATSRPRSKPPAV